MAEDLALDTNQSDVARALHRIVRSIHDGHCPSCSCVRPSEDFRHGEHQWECPECHWHLTRAEAQAAVKVFQPFMKKSLDVFERWRCGRPMQDGDICPDCRQPVEILGTTEELVCPHCHVSYETEQPDEHSQAAS